MELYKIINERLVKYNGGFVVINNVIHTNPTDELVKQAGYKSIKEDEVPEHNSESQYLERIIEDTEDAIVVHWEVKDISETPESSETLDSSINLEE